MSSLATATCLLVSTILAIIIVFISFGSPLLPFGTANLAYAEHNSPDYPVCKILCLEQVGSPVFPIYYNINRDMSSSNSNQASSKVTPDFGRNSITFEIESPVNGTINISLHGVLRAEKEDGTKIDYVVLLDGNSDNVGFRELSKDDVYREFERLEYVARSTYLDERGILSVKFPAGNHMIEILGTTIVQCGGICDVFAYSQYACPYSCDYDLKLADKVYPIQYGLRGELSGKPDSVALLSIKPNMERKSIIVTFSAEGFGTFIAYLPRYVIQSTDGSTETDFSVFVDGKRIEKFDEYESIWPGTEPYNHRILSIDFDKGAKEIEIIGTWMSDGRDFVDPEPYFPCGSFEQNCAYVLALPNSNTTVPLKYAIRGEEKTGDKEFPRLDKTYVYTESDTHSLYFYVTSPYQAGHLILELLPGLFQFDANSDFTVYGVGNNIFMNHTNIVRKDARILDVPFEKGSSEIEVIGISLFKESGDGVRPPPFPCAENDCTYTGLIGPNGRAYDLTYHISGWRNFGYPDNVRVDSMSIDPNKRSLLINVTAEQSGTMNFYLDEDILEEALGGNDGINYRVFVDGKPTQTSGDSTRTAAYFPDKTRWIFFDFERGSELIEIVGVPMQKYPCADVADFCLYHVQVDSKNYPVVFRYGASLTPTPSNPTVFKIINATVDIERKSVIFDVATEQDGTIELYFSKELIQGQYPKALVDGVRGEIGGDGDETNVDVEVHLPAGAERIEIIGTGILPEFGSFALFVLLASLVAAVLALGRLRIRA